ncbi:MAG: hypothetical protein JWO06_2323 [Bacteroidota bacterium]|nr:hypothetical protein [Bacteroidota bacterium]
MIVTEIKKKLTVEEFMQIPDAHIELIDGFVVKEASPGYGHQTVVGDIFTEIKIQLRKSKSGEIVVAPMDVFLGTHVVQPDLIFISTARLTIVRDGKIHDAPDVIFEIISPSNAFSDTKVKFDIYEQFGVKEYFIVYPEDKTVVKYVLTDGKYHEQYREIGVVRSEIIACEINF